MPTTITRRSDHSPSPRRSSHGSFRDTPASSLTSYSGTVTKLRGIQQRAGPTKLGRFLAFLVAIQYSNFKPAVVECEAASVAGWVLDANDAGTARTRPLDDVKPVRITALTSKIELRSG